MENTVESATKFLEPHEGSAQHPHWSPDVLKYMTDKMVAYANAVREIKLPEKRIINTDTPKQYHTMYKAWNACIDEIKTLNGIKP